MQHVTIGGDANKYTLLNVYIVVVQAKDAQIGKAYWLPDIMMWAVMRKHVRDQYVRWNVELYASFVF